MSANALNELVEVLLKHPLPVKYRQDSAALVGLDVDDRKPGFVKDGFIS